MTTDNFPIRLEISRVASINEPAANDPRLVDHDADEMTWEDVLECGLQPVEPDPPLLFPNRNSGNCA